MNPLPIRGLDAYAKLYADSRLWLASGWLDYFAPQLYWAIDQKEQSFPALLGWWGQQNVKGRHLWPGLYAANVGEKWGPDEITRQIKILHNQPADCGEIFFHLRNLTDNPALAAAIRTEYTQTALVPASPWLDSVPPDKPKLNVVESGRSSLSVRWETSGEAAWLWVLQYRTNEVWTTEILPANQTSRTFENSRPGTIAVRAVDRVGNLSSPAVLSPRKYSSPDTSRGATRMK
jgi:hypothetical protein